MKASHSWRLTAATAIALPAVGLLAAGCGPSGPIETEPGAVVVGASGEQSENNCDVMLGNILNMLQPDRLGISTDRTQVVDLLNQWLPKCGPKDVAPAVPGPQTTRLLASIVPASEMPAVYETRFAGRDVEHIRTCALLKAAADAAIQTAADDRERVVRLFEWVVRNVALTVDASGALPATAYDVALFGRGAAEDRAWVFAELLRQLRIDAVILRPKTLPMTGAGSSAGVPPVDAWLVGVLLDEPDKPVLLFDMRLGWAVPAADDPGGASVTRPATLAEAASDPAVLQRLAPDESHPYPLTAELLGSVSVAAILDADYCRPRMDAVQNALPAAQAMVIFDPLDDTESVAGLISRVARFGGSRWSSEDVSLWPYPEQQTRAHDNPDERQAERLKIRRRPFEAPAIVATDEQGKPRIAGSRKVQWQTRVAQVQGDINGALRSYQVIRLDSQSFNNDPRLRPLDSVMHTRAEEDAFFWTGVCQHELGENSAAIATFDAHLARYGGSEWTGHALRLSAESYARSDKLAAAVQILNRIPENDPERDGLKVLQNRLRAARQKTEQ